MQYCSVRANLFLLTLLKFHGFCVNAADLLWPLSISQLLLSWVWALYINCTVKFWPQKQNSTNWWPLLTVLCINDSLEDLSPVLPFLKCSTQKIASCQGSLTPLFWPTFCWADRAPSHVPARIPTHHTHPSMQQPSAGQEGHRRLGPVQKLWSKSFSLSIQWLASVRVTAESIWAHLSQLLGASIALSSPFFLRWGYFWVITPGEMSELSKTLSSSCWLAYAALCQVCQLLWQPM